MAINDLKLEVGKSYNIDFVVKELERAPEVQLGHIIIVMTQEHKYHVNRLQLEEIARKIKSAIAKGGEDYKKIGKKFIPLDDITILSIIDPFLKYEKYSRFYTSLETTIVQGIEDSQGKPVAAPTEALISEANKIVTIEKEEDLLNGMGIYFKRRGIDTSPLSGGKYILFQKRGPKQTATIDIVATEKEYEKYNVYTKFYEDFFNQIIEGLTARKKEDIAAPIDAVVNEAQKLGYAVKDNEAGFFRGMELYFRIRKIEMERSDKYLMFKKVQ